MLQSVQLTLKWVHPSGFKRSIREFRAPSRSRRATSWAFLVSEGRPIRESRMRLIASWPARIRGLLHHGVRGGVDSNANRGQICPGTSRLANKNLQRCREAKVIFTWTYIEI